MNLLSCFVVRFEMTLIILRIAVRGPDETPVRAPKALVLIRFLVAK